MKVNLKKPRYIVPIIALPFLCLFYYVFSEFNTSKQPQKQQSESLQENIVDVSEEIKKRELSDKLAAYRNQYKYGDGYTAIGQLEEEQVIEYKFDELYNEKEKHILDSIEKSFSSKQLGYSAKNYHSPNESLAIQNALENIPYLPNHKKEEKTKIDDPMDLFRKQMMLADSFAKANHTEPKSQEIQLEALQQNSKEDFIPNLKVEKFSKVSEIFNTVKSKQDESLIKAMIDENRTAFSDSRLRIRLLEDLRIAHYKINKGTFLYAQVTGFSTQRVQLSIKSILHKDKILPINLEIYDQDGQLGLYIPASSFRDFSKELSSNASQGIALNQQQENNSQLLMGMLQRMFQSTSSAINKNIKRNKANIKYNTHVYLIDSK